MKTPISLIFALASLNLFAGVQSTLVLDKVITHKDCEMSDSCSLKEFNVQVSDYVVTSAGEKSYGTNAYISYETDSIDTIEDYAIVQFIRGCVYNEIENENGALEKRKGIARKFFGSYQKFIHPEWVIDSIDEDPIYNSSEVRESRHDYYRWNEDPQSYGDDNEHYVLQKYPTHPKVYVSDLPSSSFFSHDSAKNTNLEFQTCIYKTSEIPRKLEPSDVNFAEPLHCIEWKTSNVYNFKEKKYVQDRSIEESCSDLY